MLILLWNNIAYFFIWINVKVRQDAGQELIRHGVNVTVSVYFSGVEMVSFMIFDHIIDDISSDKALQFPAIQLATADRNGTLTFSKWIHEI